MAAWSDVAGVWKNLREFDLAPLRDAAESDTRLALIGRAGVGKHSLANQLRTDPARPNLTTQTPITIGEPNSSALNMGADADLIILMTDASDPDSAAEQILARQLIDSGKKVIVIDNRSDLSSAGSAAVGTNAWSAARMMTGSVLDREFLTSTFVPAVIDLLPDKMLSLGRHFPLFREPIARKLITETCNANAIYSVTTGLAETVPILDVPLNIGDMLVLTKAQALLVYKLGLLLGFSTDWRSHLAEFGGIIGGGFLWRQLARELVGLIPGWGLVPKVGVAYAGTYVVGHTILQWYLTGRKISGQQLRELYAQAWQQGKEFAMGLIAKVPRPNLPMLKSPREHN